MPAKLECPICLCSIKNKKTDFIATSCGHCFHASCLMKHLSMNGFSCPYCRNIMAEESNEQEEDEDDEVPLFMEEPAPVPEPVVEPTVVKRKIIEGKRYLMDKYNNLYDYEALVRDGNDVIVGLWDPAQDRVVERLIDV